MEILFCWDCLTFGTYARVIRKYMCNGFSEREDDGEEEESTFEICKLIEILQKGRLVYSLERERVKIFYAKDGYFDLINGTKDYKIVSDIEEDSASINLAELPLDLRAEVTTKVSELLNVGIDLARNVLAEFPEIKEEDEKIILLANPVNYSKYFLGFVRDIEAWLKAGRLIKAVRSRRRMAML